MKLLSSGSHNIAWFKLAEFVSRGEKERALTVYKLLMHSITDQAFAYQLEGDILLAFDDDAAIEKYHLAANIYKKNGNYQKAIAVYEHVALFKNDLKILEALLDVYDVLQDQIGIINSFARFAILAVQFKNFGLLINRLHVYLMTRNNVLKAELYGYTFFALLFHDTQNPQIEMYLFQALDLYIKADDPTALTKFMAKLKVSHDGFYTLAQDVLLEGAKLDF
jgi:tetratricopeptide (TPR) repeat protein